MSGTVHLPYCPALAEGLCTCKDDVLGHLDRVFGVNGVNRVPATNSGTPETAR